MTAHPDFTHFWCKAGSKVGRRIEAADSRLDRRGVASVRILGAARADGRCTPESTHAPGAVERQ